MSLFARLLALSDRRVPTEDVLTEVVAHLFRLDAAARGAAGGLDGSLVVRWLRAVGALDDGPVAAVRVGTQRTYAPVGDGGRAGRPDLVVEVDRGGATEVVLVESKVDSGEGPDQLRAYAEQLRVRHGRAARRTLVYLTRNHDPKDPGEVVPAHGPPTGVAVEFLPARWYGVYRTVDDGLPSAPPVLGSLYADVLAFLAHLQMDLDTRLGGDDALALARAPRALRLLHATLFSGSPGVEAPARAFKRVTGWVSGETEAAKQVVPHGRYVAAYNPAGGEVLLGYRLGGDAGLVALLQLGTTTRTDEGRRAAAALRRLLENRPARVDGLDGRPVELEWETWDDARVRWAGGHLAVPVGGGGDLGRLRHVLLGLVGELGALWELEEFPWTALHA